MVLLKSSKAWLRYEKKSMPNKSNHKPQAYASVCKEIALEEKQLPVKIFCSERIDFGRL